MLRAMAPFANAIEWTTSMLGVYEFMPSNDMMLKSGKMLCMKSSAKRELCANALFLLCGYDSMQLNRSLIPEILKITPAGKKDELQNISCE
jgi:hypothetical protein